jgi:hypothetical protein
MHHSIGAVQPVHWRIERHDEHPSFAGIPGIVDKFGKDELGVMLRFRHDTEDNCPSYTASNSPESADQVHCW